MRLAIRVRFQNSQKGTLRNGNRPDYLHPLFAFLLLLQKLSLTSNITPVAFGCHILTEGRDRRAGDDLSPDRPLNGNLKHLPGDFFL